MIEKTTPEILAFLPNLSENIVLTPLSVVNDVLDLLPSEVWSNPDLRWLDPACKSGIFPREITKRLMKGLAHVFPNERLRLDHILKNMVFAFAIDPLGSQISRRTLYGSINAADSKSFVSMPKSDGNIWYGDVSHTRKGSGKCVECGAPGVSPQGAASTRDAYGFIHANGRASIEKEIEMRFDVVVGNPPYQMSDGGGEGSSAVPLYHLFVKAAMKLDAQYIAMIIQARWYSGGKGLDDFRDSMLKEAGLAEIHDFPETDLVFPGITIRGGVCYFLWAHDHVGKSKIINYRKSGPPIAQIRPLLEDGLSTFVRYNEAISILNKVRSKGEETYDKRVQSRNPYGIASNFNQFSTKKTSKSTILLYRSRRGLSENREVYIRPDQIASNGSFVDRWKVIVSKASPGGDAYPHAVFSTPIVAGPSSVSTETYLIVDFVASEFEGNNLVSYMKTCFFRFLVSLMKNTQNIAKGSFAFVPVIDLSKSWTDDELYEKYGITEEERAFIAMMVKVI